MAVHYRTPDHKRYQPLPVQGKRASDTPGLDKYACSKCRIDYSVLQGQSAICPLCESKQESESLRRQVDSLARKVELLETDLEVARSESSMVDAMRQALALADPEDVAEIKAIAYRWRDDPQKLVVLATNVSPTGSKWALETRQRNRPGGNTDVFVPVSVGGVAFVETYRDLTKARGNVRAMEGYSQAIASQLAL